ncbi:MAG: hypothetical protein WA705_12125 [Candidatus Ozemobacteraceae bacterium]
MGKTEGCTIAVPARKVIVGDVEIPVPAHFRAWVPLSIIDFSPKSKAGTPFPTISVSLIGVKPPLSVRMTLNGNMVKTRIEKDLVIYQPAFDRQLLPGRRLSGP